MVSPFDVGTGTQIDDYQCYYRLKMERPGFGWADIAALLRIRQRRRNATPRLQSSPVDHPRSLQVLSTLLDPLLICLS